MSVDQILKKAKKLLAKKKFDLSEKNFARVLEQYPANTTAIHGITGAQEGMASNDIRVLLGLFNKHQYQRCAELAGVLSQRYKYVYAIWELKGAALSASGLHSLSVDAFKMALLLRPDNSTANLNLSSALLESGAIGESIEFSEKAAKLEPRNWAAHLNLGTALLHKEEYQAARQALESAIRINSENHMALLKMARLEMASGAPERALPHINKSLSLDTTHKEALCELATYHQLMEEWSQAIFIYDNLVSSHPNDPKILNNLGVSQKRGGRIGDAIQTFKSTIKLDPEFLQAYVNLGNCHQYRGEIKEAKLAYKKALEIDPESPDANTFLAHSHLLNKEFETGFNLLEFRYGQRQQAGRRIFESERPYWSGQNCETLLVWGEWGIGDEIMFASLIPDLAKHCDRLLILCDSRLKPLLSRSFSGNVQFLNSKEEAKSLHFDFHISSTSAAQFLRRELSKFSLSAHGYLKPNAKFVKEYMASVSAYSNKTLIGLSWHTKSSAGGAEFRSIPLELLISALPNEHLTFISLQYGEAEEDIDRLSPNDKNRFLTIPELDRFTEIDKLAALMAVCDGIITIDNITPHLAGALNCETHLLLPVNRDWRWALEGDVSYWYDSVRLYRQEHANNWAEVLNQVALSSFVKNPKTD